MGARPRLAPGGGLTASPAGRHGLAARPRGGGSGARHGPSPRAGAAADGGGGQRGAGAAAVPAGGGVPRHSRPRPRRWRARRRDGAGRCPPGRGGAAGGGGCPAGPPLRRRRAPAAGRGPGSASGKSPGQMSWDLWRGAERPAGTCPCWGVLGGTAKGLWGLQNLQGEHAGAWAAAWRRGIRGPCRWRCSPARCLAGRSAGLPGPRSKAPGCQVDAAAVTQLSWGEGFTGQSKSTRWGLWWRAPGPHTHPPPRSLQMGPCDSEFLGWELGAGSSPDSPCCESCWDWVSWGRPCSSSPESEELSLTESSQLWLATVQAPQSSLQRCPWSPTRWDGGPVPLPWPQPESASSGGLPSSPRKLRRFERQLGLRGCVLTGAKLEQSPGVMNVKHWKTSEHLSLRKPQGNLGSAPRRTRRARRAGGCACPQAASPSSFPHQPLALGWEITKGREEPA